MNEWNSDVEIQNTERPKGLLIVCILSWINIGFTIVTSLIRMLGGPLTDSQMRNNKVEMLSAINESRETGFDWLGDLMEKVMYMTEVFNNNHYAVHGLTLLFMVIGLVGVLFMFQGKKLGFHLYIIYNILVIVHVFFFLSPAAVPMALTIWSVAISGFFVALYGRHLSWMK